jgi:hypothetical protein
MSSIQNFVKNMVQFLLGTFTKLQTVTISFIMAELFVPTNALRQFFHCFLYYKDAPIRISAVILPSSGGLLSEFFT